MVGLSEKQIRSNVTKEVAAYISNLLETKLSNQYTFHNAQHTRDVVRAAEQIGKNCGLSEEDFDVLLTAAWFHDIGYTETYEGHEAIGVQLAEEFLSQMGCNPDFIERVISCILATQMPQQPRNLVEEVLCDADVENVGSDTFFEMSSRLRQELETIKGETFTDSEWFNVRYSFCRYHIFHTEYARRVLGEKQKENLAMLEKERSEVAAESM